MRNQYYRQINLCKKSSLNWYESCNLVGYLLDLIYSTRKLEEMKLRLVRDHNDFNLLDAWRMLQPRAYSPTIGTMNQIDLREGLMRNGLKGDKVQMDRIYLLFKRYNTSRDDQLRF